MLFPQFVVLRICGVFSISFSRLSSENLLQIMLQGVQSTGTRSNGALSPLALTNASTNTSLYKQSPRLRIARNDFHKTALSRLGMRDARSYYCSQSSERYFMGKWSSVLIKTISGNLRSFRIRQRDGLKGSR
jgi:hypothetical protein